MRRRHSALIWEDQFDPQRDFPDVGGPTQKYVICSTPRSGSHLLGHLLWTQRRFGYPLEYMHPRNIRRWQERAASEGFDDVLSLLYSRRTSPNGCFGIKLHYRHLANYMERVGNESLVNGHRFILLRREDLLDQAVSYALAQQTGAWVAAVKRVRTPVYSYQLIAAKMESIARQHAQWQLFLSSYGVNVLTLTYEMIIEDTETTIREIVKFLGVNGRTDNGAVKSPIDRQRTEINSQWRSQFVEETRLNGDIPRFEN